MRDRAKERGQRAEAVVSSLLPRMGKEPWGPHNADQITLRPGWPGTHRDPPTFPAQVLGRPVILGWSPGLCDHQKNTPSAEPSSPVSCAIHSPNPRRVTILLDPRRCST
ncbi:hypothetical protein LEMLEM_LOCUS25774 [Lemmus lemmus]